MRELPLSKCEYEFVTKCIRDRERLDGRNSYENREIKIEYKLDFGCCIVSVGKTKILAQVAAEMDRPKESRSNEGNLGIFVEMSTMASPGFDPAKPGELGIELQRMLERSILFSKAVDLEELCVRVGEQAWNISLHIQIISHDGNILDCASIAAIAALSHFKRPDVTVIGKEVKVHTFEEKNPVHLTFNHHPFCVTFAYFDNGTISVADPTKLEESCCDGKLVIAMNKHKEVCCMQMSGVVQVDGEQVLKCVNLASIKVKELSNFVKKSITNDEEAKRKNLKSSITTSSSVKNYKTPEKSDPKTHSAAAKVKVVLPTKEETEKEEGSQQETSSINQSQKLSWVMKNNESTYSAGEDSVSLEKMKLENQGVDAGSDDEEETTVTLQLS